MSDCGTNPQILSVYLDLQGAGFWFSVSGGNQDESQSPTPFFPWKPMPPLRSLFLSLLSLTRLETSGSYVYLPLPWSQFVKSWRFCFFYSFHIWVSFPFPMQSPKHFLFRLLFTFWLPVLLDSSCPTSLHSLHLRRPHELDTHSRRVFYLLQFSSHALRIGHTGLSNFLSIPRTSWGSYTLALHFCSNYFSCFECSLFNSNRWNHTYPLYLLNAVSIL